MSTTTDRAPAPVSPSRDDDETTSGTTSGTIPLTWTPLASPTPVCPVCGTSFRPAGRQYYCSDRCRKTAWRRRHQPAPEPAPVPAGRPRRDNTVYQCPDCGDRQLGVQRCENCGLFMRRVAAGGPCPHCDQPVALTDLLQPPQPPKVTPLP